jgi:hypothetical protein
MRFFSAILGILLCATTALAGAPDFVHLPDKAAYRINLHNAEVIVGGELPNDKFVPSVRATKFNGEAFVEIKPKGVTINAEKEVSANGKITIEAQGRKHRFYPLSEDSLEYEVEFPSRPSGNTIQFTLSKSPNVSYAKQILSQEAIDRGDTYSRPDAEGSYAFFIDKIDNQYESGKVAHIWRPKLIDNLGAESWCDMDIQGNTLTITMDSDFLDNAAYPVILDPILGYSSQGAKVFSASLTSVLTRHFLTDADGGTIQSFHAWANNSDGTADDFIAVGAYNVDQSTFSPAGKSLVEFGRAITDTVSATPIELSVTASGSGVLAGNTYYGVGRQIAVAILYDDGFAAVNAYYYFLAGATDDWGDPCPAVTTAPGWTTKYSAWMVYGNGGGSTSRTKLGYPKMIEMDF